MDQIDSKYRRKLLKRLEKYVFVNNEHCKYPVLKLVTDSLNWKTCNDGYEAWDVYWTDSGQNISRWVKLAKKYQKYIMCKYNYPQ